MKTYIQQITNTYKSFVLKICLLIYLGTWAIFHIFFLNRNTNEKKIDMLADSERLPGTSSACRTLNNSPSTFGLWKRETSGRRGDKPDPPPNKGKCEYDKASLSDTQANKQPSVIIISGTRCAALKRERESFMPGRQLLSARLSFQLLSQN